MILCQMTLVNPIIVSIFREKEIIIHQSARFLQSIKQPLRNDGSFRRGCF